MADRTRIDEIVDQTLNLEPDRRESYLNEACGDDETLRDEVERALMTALEKNRERRYPLVADFLEDIRRYRKNLPIRARTPSRWYRTRKFVRRHRIAVGAVGISFLLSVSVLGAIVWALVQVGRETAASSAVMREMSRVLISGDWRDVEASRSLASDIDAQLESDEWVKKTALSPSTRQTPTFARKRLEAKGELLLLAGRLHAANGSYQIAGARFEESLDALIQADVSPDRVSQALKAALGARLILRGPESALDLLYQPRVQQALVPAPRELVLTKVIGWMRLWARVFEWNDLDTYLRAQFPQPRWTIRDRSGSKSWQAAKMLEMEIERTRDSVHEAFLARVWMNGTRLVMPIPEELAGLLCGLFHNPRVAHSGLEQFMSLYGDRLTERQRSLANDALRQSSSLEMARNPRRISAVGWCESSALILAESYENTTIREVYLWREAAKLAAIQSDHQEAARLYRIADEKAHALMGPGELWLDSRIERVRSLDALGKHDQALALLLAAQAELDDSSDPNQQSSQGGFRLARMLTTEKHHNSVETDYVAEMEGRLLRAPTSNEQIANDTELMWAYVDRGRHRDAAQLFGDLTPRNTRALMALGIGLLEEGASESAIKLLEKLASPQYAPTLRALIYWIDLPQSPHAQARCYLAEAYLDQDRVHDADRAVTQALGELANSDARTRWLTIYCKAVAASIRLAMGESMAARALFDEVLDQRDEVRFASQVHGRRFYERAASFYRAIGEDSKGRLLEEDAASLQELLSSDRHFALVDGLAWTEF